jgi:hypothetical protein
VRVARLLPDHARSGASCCLPGLIGSNGWAGVLMPSVDRVGRQFPLTLVAGALLVCRVAQRSSMGWMVRRAGSDSSRRARPRRGDLMTSINRLLTAASPRRRPRISLPRTGAPCGGCPPSTRGLSCSPRRKRSAPGAGTSDGADSGGHAAAWTAIPLMLTCAALPTAEEFGWLLQSRLSPAERDDTNPSAYT